MNYHCLRTGGTDFFCESGHSECAYTLYLHISIVDYMLFEMIDELCRVDNCTYVLASIVKTFENQFDPILKNLSAALIF